jgi:OOP family OmpA-OmpF porin
MGAARGVFAAIALAIPAYASNGAAQTLPSIDARTWRPSTDPQANLVLEPAVTPGPWRWNVGAWAEYASNPVVWRDAPGGATITPVRNTIGAELVAGLGIGERAAVGAEVPFFLWQDGASSLPAGIVTGGAVPKSGIGDVTLTGKATIVSNDRQSVHAGPALAALAALSFPTGDRASFVGEGAITSSLRLLAEYALGVVAARASLGYVLRTERRTWPDASLGGVTFGDTIPWTVGITLRPKVLAPFLDSGDKQVWEIATHGSLPAGPVAPFGTGKSGASALSPALLAADDRIALGRDGDVYLLVGGELGLDAAVGVPRFRALMSIGWAPRVHDRDGDGVPDDVDECPDLPEDRDGLQDQDGCPEDDADGDGILDETDACPLVPGAPSDDPKKNGCPGPAPRREEGP